MASLCLRISYFCPSWCVEKDVFCVEILESMTAEQLAELTKMVEAPTRMSKTLNQTTRFLEIQEITDSVRSGHIRARFPGLKPPLQTKIVSH